MSNKKEKSIIATHIQELRSKNQETQQELADKLHVSKQTVSKIEQGIVNVTLENAIEIANYYKVSLDWLTGRSENNSIDILDIITQFIHYSIREPFSFEHNEAKDDNPFVDMYINSSLHQCLVELASIDMMQAKLDIPCREQITKKCIEGVKKEFAEEIKSENGVKLPVTILEREQKNKLLKTLGRR